MDVELSRDGGAHWTKIGSRVSGVSHQWTVTSPATGQALVRVVNSDFGTVSSESPLSFTILGSHAAASTSVGPGCTGAASATLTVGAPLLGLPFPVAVTGAVPFVPGALFGSAPHALPPVVMPGGCLVHLELATAVELTSFVSGSTGAWSQSFTLPAAPALVGLRTWLQGACVTPGVGPGYQLTNAVDVEIGY